MQPNDQKAELYNQLIEGCKNNNREAQYKLYNLLSGKMFAVCLRYAKNREAAEDILQLVNKKLDSMPAAVIPGTQGAVKPQGGVKPTPKPTGK